MESNRRQLATGAATGGALTTAVQRSTWYARYFYSYVDRFLDFSNAYVSRRVRVSLSTLWPRLLASSRALGLDPNVAAMLQLAALLVLYIAFTALYVTYILGVVMGGLYAIGAGLWSLCGVTQPLLDGQQYSWIPSRWQVARNVFLGTISLGIIVWTAVYGYERRFYVLGVWQMVSRGFAPRLPSAASASGSRSGHDQRAAKQEGPERPDPQVCEPRKASQSATSTAPGTSQSASMAGSPAYLVGTADLQAWHSVHKKLTSLPAGLRQALLLLDRWENLVSIPPAHCSAAAECCAESRRLLRLHQVVPLPSAALPPSWHASRQPTGFVSAAHVRGCPIGSKRVPWTSDEVIAAAQAHSGYLPGPAQHPSQPVSPRQARILHLSLCSGLCTLDARAERELQDAEFAYRASAAGDSLDFLEWPQWRTWLESQGSSAKPSGSESTIIWHDGSWYGWWFGLLVAQWVSDACDVHLTLPLRVMIALSVQGLELTHIESLMSAVDAVGGTHCAVALRKGPLLQHIRAPRATPASSTFLRHVLRWLIPPGPNEAEWMASLHSVAKVRLQQYSLLPMFPPDADSHQARFQPVYYCMASDQLLQGHRLNKLPQVLLPDELKEDNSPPGLSHRHIAEFASRVLGTGIRLPLPRLERYLVLCGNSGALQQHELTADEARRDLQVLVPLVYGGAKKCGISTLLQETRMLHVWDRWGSSNSDSAVSACLAQLRFARTAGSTESGSNMAESTSAFDKVSHAVDAAQVHGTSLRRTVSRPLLAREGSSWSHLDRCPLELHTYSGPSRIGGFVSRIAALDTPGLELLASMPQALAPTEDFQRVVESAASLEQQGSRWNTPFLERFRRMPGRLQQVLARMGHSCTSDTATQHAWGIDAACQHPVLGHGWESTPPNRAPSASIMPDPIWEAFVPIACVPSPCLPFPEIVAMPWQEMRRCRPQLPATWAAAWAPPLSKVVGCNDAGALRSWVQPLLAGDERLHLQSQALRRMCIRLAASALAYSVADSTQAAACVAKRLKLQARPAFESTAGAGQSCDELLHCALHDARFLQRHSLALRRVLGMPWRGWGPFVAEFLMAHGTRQARLAQQFPVWAPPQPATRPLGVHKSVAEQRRHLRWRPSALLKRSTQVGNRQPPCVRVSDFLRLVLPAAPCSGLNSADEHAHMSKVLDDLASCGEALRTVLSVADDVPLQVGGWAQAGSAVVSAEDESNTAARSHWVAACRGGVPADNNMGGPETPPGQVWHDADGDNADAMDVLPELPCDSAWLNATPGGEAAAPQGQCCVSGHGASWRLKMFQGGVTILPLLDEKGHSQQQEVPPAGVSRAPSDALAVDEWLRHETAHRVQRAFPHTSLRRLLLLSARDQDLLLDLAACRAEVKRQLSTGIPGDAFAAIPGVPFLNSP